MDKVAIITFHAAHNYGSCLQALATQTVVDSMGFEAEIINFRPDKQRDLYNVFTKRKGIKYFLKNGYVALTYKDRKSKYDKFENFVNNLKLTKTYSCLEELDELKDEYFACITGSDQVWNVPLQDYDDAYMLSFLGDLTKRIAYAPSCGDELMASYYNEHISQLLNKFDAIAVRDIETASMCEMLTGDAVDVVIDPTLLLDGKFYADLCKDGIKIEEEYIFLYTLGNSAELIKIAKEMSAKFGLPVYVSNITGVKYIFNFNKVCDAGPLDFLSLIKGAKYVVTTSFHATIFSILFNKQFWTVGADKDNRKKQLLTMFGLTERNIDYEHVEKLDLRISQEQYDGVKVILERERQKAMQYLEKALKV